MRRYTGEEYEILRKSIYSVLDELWNIAKTFKKDIKGIAYNPSHQIIAGLWMKMFVNQYIDGVFFDVVKSFENKEFMSSLTHDTLNVLFINQKVVNAQPKAELVKAKDFNFHNYEFTDKIDYIMIVTDDITLSLMETDIQAELLVEDWVNTK